MRFSLLLFMAMSLLAAPPGRVSAVPPAKVAEKAGIVLTSPLDYQVFQRSSREQGTIELSGQLKGVAGNLLLVTITGRPLAGQLPVDGERVTVSIDPTTGEFHHQLSIPAGGWYRMNLRATKEKVRVAEKTIDHVGVGEVFVVAGQSNSSNFGAVKQQPKSGMVASFDGQTWRVANDPQLGVQDGSKGGSFLPAMGDALFARYHVPIGVASTGAGATSVRQWLPKGEKMNRQPTISSLIKPAGPGQWESTGQLFEGLMKRVEKLGPHGCRAILWHQGESDAGQARGGYPADRQITGDDYQRYLTTLINASRKRAGWDVPWFVAQVSYHSEKDAADEEFRKAQRAMWKSKDVLEGPDSDSLRAEFRAGVHFNAKGLDAHGKLWADKIGQYLDKQLAVKKDDEQPKTDRPAE
ncbi:MAG: sialate O-acetylesterase [Planctomycetes bacterium]|nr:sialate O-acetylesterase [Planctomycetota bacterium]